MMRITVHLPDKLAEEIKRYAKDEGVSVSRFVAKSLEEYIREGRKKKHAERILMMARENLVSDDALEELERGRLDDRI